jgi:sec-independent protein translocase protein TatA
MGSMSIGHWLIVLAIVLLLFGANKIPRLMGDLAKGIKAFKSGMKEENEKVEDQAKPVDVTPTAAAAAKTAEAEKKV